MSTIIQGNLQNGCIIDADLIQSTVTLEATVVREETTIVGSIIRSGEAGPQGIVGPPGSQLIWGMGIPGSGVGADGDTFIDETAGVFYGPKAGGSWAGTGPKTLDGRYYTKATIDANLALKQDTSEKGQPNGYASLDANGKVPASQLTPGPLETTIVGGDIILGAVDHGTHLDFDVAGGSRNLTFPGADPIGGGFWFRMSVRNTGQGERGIVPLGSPSFTVYPQMTLPAAGASEFRIEKGSYLVMQTGTSSFILLALAGVPSPPWVFLDQAIDTDKDLTNNQAGKLIDIFAQINDVTITSKLPPVLDISGFFAMAHLRINPGRKITFTAEGNPPYMIQRIPDAAIGASVDFDDSYDDHFAFIQKTAILTTVYVLPMGVFRINNGGTGTRDVWAGDYLTTQLAGKANSSHPHIPGDITGFDTAVSGNSDVSQNSTARHTHANKPALDGLTDGGDGRSIHTNSGGYSKPEFRTDDLKVKDAADLTKVVEMDASGVGTGQTRKLKMPDADVDLVKANLAAITDPGVDDDSADGYSMMSPWINTTAPRKLFVCLNPAPGAAVWQEVGAGGGGASGTSKAYKISKSGTQTSTDSYVTLSGMGTSSGDLPMTEASGELTFDQSTRALVSIDVQGETTGSDRIQMDVKVQKNTGGGWTDVTELEWHNYAIRNAVQTEGGLLGIFWDDFDVGDKIRIQIKDTGVAYDVKTGMARISIISLDKTSVGYDPGTWTNCTLGTGWAVVSGQTLQVKKDENGYVQMRGVIERVTGSGNDAATLPAGFYPPADLAFPITANASGSPKNAGVIITSAGAIEEPVFFANSYAFNFAGICWWD